jgi:hypothetical protein
MKQKSETPKTFETRRRRRPRPTWWGTAIVSMLGSQQRRSVRSCLSARPRCCYSSVPTRSAIVRGFVTGASDHSRDRRVRSRTQESSAEGSLIGRGGASGHMRPDASGQQSRSLEPLWTTTRRWHCRVQSRRGARPVTLYLRA